MTEESSSSSSIIKSSVTVGCTIILTAITVGGLLLACGSVVGDIDQNKTTIGKHTATLELHAKEIVQGKLNDQKQAALSTNTLNVLTSVNSKLESIIQMQGIQSTDIALMKQKIEGKK